MKTKQKLLIIYLVSFISVLPSCATIYAPASIKPKMSVTDATNSLKEAIKDTIGTSVTNVSISEEGITLSYEDNIKIHYAFNDIPDPAVVDDGLSSYSVLLKRTDNSSFFDYKFYGELHWNNSKSASRFADALYYLKHRDLKTERAQENENFRRVIHTTPINVIFSGATADELASGEVNREPAESMLNNVLIEWKNKGLPEVLQKSSPSQLSDLVINLEKGILKLDLNSKKLKDLADQDARQVIAPGQEAPAKKAPADALATALLLEQRKTILMVILGSVKQAAAQRASGG